LPVVSTAGDSFARLIAADGLGAVVPEGDVNALTAALERVLYDPDFATQCRANVARVAPRFDWDQTLQPLLRFCRNPVRAADVNSDVRRIARHPTPPASRIIRAGVRVPELLRQGGLPLLGRQIVAKARNTAASRFDTDPDRG